MENQNLKNMITNGKHLITSDCWFMAPDGEYYRGAFGDVEILNDTEALGIKTNARSANWFAKVGTSESYVLIAGCQIHYAVRCDEINVEALKARPKTEIDPDTIPARIWAPKEVKKEYSSGERIKDFADAFAYMHRSWIPEVPAALLKPFQLFPNTDEVVQIRKEINEKGVTLSAEHSEPIHINDETVYKGNGILENVMKAVKAQHLQQMHDLSESISKAASSPMTGKFDGLLHHLKETEQPQPKVTEYYSRGVDQIAQERAKQISKYGYTASHSVDVAPDWYKDNQLRDAALNIIMSTHGLPYNDYFTPKNWSADKFTELKTRSVKERLQIAGAFIAAEIDRLQYIEEGIDNNVRKSTDDLGTIKIDMSGIETGIDSVNKVLAEMERQDNKYGADRNLIPNDWISILTEEVGEVAKEWNDASLDVEGLNLENYEVELIQVAAVALQAVKNIKKYPTE